MRLFLLTVLTMLAFAANSILNRLALVDGSIDAQSFAIVRLAAGAATLAMLALILRGRLQLGGRGRMVGVLALLVYIYGFSNAYIVLDAGVGALILFGVVQITMFAGAVLSGERPPLRRVLGAALAFGGLVWLLWPSAGPVVSVLHGGLMAAAGVGWGVYSLNGRREGDPLQATAANFLLAVPVGLVLSLLVPMSAETLPATARGLSLAVVSGAITSGLGYALWYSVLPRLPASVAAVAQLTVPVIAMAGGMLFLSETLTLTFVLASVLVLGGVAISVARRT
jgi:drug/metabolite transporter (DMT)-like permease